MSAAAEAESLAYCSRSQPLLARALALLCCAVAGDAVAQGATCPIPVIGRLFADGFDLPVGGDLTQPGAFATQTASGTVVRGMRSVPWSANLPTGTSGPLPWLVFVSGANIPRASYASLGQHLASYGYVVVRTEFALPFFDPDHLEAAADIRAVIDALSAPQALAVPVDATRTALGGHSLGGKIAILAAAGDSRVRAAILFDPLNINGGAMTPSVVPQPMGSLQIPLAVLGETTDAAGAVACAPAAINYRTMFDAATATPRGYEWTIDGASHNDFVSDPAACGVACTVCQAPTLPPDRTRAFVRSTSVAFLDTHLRPGPSRCDWLTGIQVPGYVSTRIRLP